MRAKQQHVCKEMNQYILYIRNSNNTAPSIGTIAGYSKALYNDWIIRVSIYDQYQPEMDSKFQHGMDNRSEVQEIAL